MSSLYNKYRPTTLKGIYGNQELVSSLRGMVDKNEIPHTILLHGPTGCGKTTIGRIIATELGAVDFDFREIDSADFRGIDTIREIRRQAHLAPLRSPVKVYLIDECHKITNDGQNALLKILEDTPKHVYFILATTDPQKLLKTVRGRCSAFKVETLQDEQMYKLLKKVTVREGEKGIDKEILERIAEDSEGHPRNALQVLEQVLHTAPEKRMEMAKRQADVNTESIELARALTQNKGWKTISSILTGLKQEDPEGIRRMILGYCQAVLLKSDNEKCGLIMEEMLEPFYNTGFPGLTYACYSITKN